MPIYKKFKTETYESFLQDSYNNNYGISEEKIAKYFIESKTYVVKQYGLTYENMLSTYIPELKSRLNGGYVFFLLYTITEGGGAGNWINHYASDTASTGLQCLKDDCDYLNSVTKSFPVCKSAHEVLNGQKYIDDENGRTDKFWATVKDKSIGAMWMPSTMAGNAWVWGTQWTLENQGPVPKCYFGNCYDYYLKMVSDLGGDLSFNDDLPSKPIDTNESNDSGGTSSGGGSDSKNEPDKTEEETTILNNLEKLKEEYNNVKNAVVDSVKKMNTSYLFANTLNQSIMSNSGYVVTRMYGNAIKLKTTSFFSKVINEVIEGVNNIDPEKEPTAENENSEVGGGSESEQPIIEPKPTNNNFPKPKLNSIYYIGRGYGNGVSPTLVIHPENGSTLANCVGYAYGRCYEILGKDPKLWTGNAGTWWSNVSGYEKGSTPRKGAVMCWSGGYNNYGHVAFVEKVNKKTVTLSQSNYVANSTGYEYSTFDLPHSGLFSGSGLTFQGYIYVIPTTKKFSKRELRKSTFNINNYESGKLVNESIFTIETLPIYYKENIIQEMPNFSIPTNNIFSQNGKKGCANEFVYYYLKQLSGNEQPILNENGEIPKPKDLYKLYNEVSNFPNVGNGFSVVSPFGGANLYNYGFCGVVIAQLQDGSFLACGYDMKPFYAPSREIIFFNINGLDIESIDKFKFFEPL